MTRWRVTIDREVSDEPWTPGYPGAPQRGQLTDVLIIHQEMEEGAYRVERFLFSPSGLVRYGQRITGFDHTRGQAALVFECLKALFTSSPLDKPAGQ